MSEDIDKAAVLATRVESLLDNGAVAADWVTTPAPGEEKLPPVTPVHRADPGDAGVWVADHHGWYAPVRMVDITIGCGWQLTEEDQEILEWARSGNLSPEGQEHLPDVWHEIQDDAERWLNENVAPEGHSFGWLDGDFMLGSEEMWCAWTEHQCPDPDHNHTVDY